MTIQQCNTIENGSTLPNYLFFETTERISLGPNKAHGHDRISICMLKLCASTISKPLFLLLKHNLENECFLSEWKKANIVPIYNKKAISRWFKIINPCHY